MIGIENRGLGCVFGCFLHSTSLSWKVPQGNFPICLPFYFWSCERFALEPHSDVNYHDVLTVIICHNDVKSRLNSHLGLVGLYIKE